MFLNICVIEKYKFFVNHDKSSQQSRKIET